MIKGLNRQVIVVEPEGSEIFEQAIFFVRVSAARKGVGKDELLREAGRIIGGRIAGYYPPEKKKGFFRRKKKDKD